MRKYQQLVKIAAAGCVVYSLLCYVYTSTKLLRPPARKIVLNLKLDNSEIIFSETVHVKDPKPATDSITLRMLFEHVNNLARTDPQSNFSHATNRAPRCQEGRHFALIEIPITGQNMSDMFQHFAASRNLSVVIPSANGSSFNWPHSVNQNAYKKPKRKVDRSTGMSRLYKFNALIAPAIYNKEQMEKFMSQYTVYITAMREPVHQLKATLANYQYGKRTFMGSNRTSDEVLQAFFRNPEHLDTVYQSFDHSDLELLENVPGGLSITKNFLAFHLGFPTGYHLRTTDQSQNLTYIKEWLTELHGTFKLAVIYERLYESLIVLKHYLCWTWKELLFSSMVFSPAAKPANGSKEYFHMFRYKWSYIDTLVYRLFDQTLTYRMKQIRGISSEIRAFKNVVIEIQSFCRKSQNDKPLIMSSNKWHSGFNITNQDCSIIFKQANRNNNSSKN